jgi:hypothetical protein
VCVCGGGGKSLESGAWEQLEQAKATRLSVVKLRICMLRRCWGETQITACMKGCCTCRSA